MVCGKTWNCLRIRLCPEPRWKYYGRDRVAVLTCACPLDHESEPMITLNASNDWKIEQIKAQVVAD